MGGLHHQWKDGFQLRVLRNHYHLHPGNHDVSHPKLRELHDAFDHGQRLGVDDMALFRIAQEHQQILAILGLPGEK